MDVLLVCKPSGKNAMSFFVAMGAFLALSVMWVYEGIEDPECCWMLLITVPVTVLFFFLFRFQFVGEEQLGIDGKDLTEKQVECFRERLYEYVMSKEMDVNLNLNELYK